MDIRPIQFPLRASGELARGGFSGLISVARGSVEALWRALVSRARRRPKSLVLVESSALGDRRLVSVVQFERQRFLVGSSPSSVTLLARLPSADAIPGDGDAAAAGGESQ